MLWSYDWLSLDSPYQLYTYSINTTDEIVHTAGKNLMTADTLSQAPGSVPAEQECLMEVETHNHVCSVLGAIPARDAHLEEIRQKQLDDHICSQVITFCKLDHWPERAKKDEELRAYWLVWQDLSVQAGLLLYQCHLVIPALLQEDILQRLHQGHQGIVKCRALARESVWWPGLSKRMEKVVEACLTCEKDRQYPEDRQYPPEPMRPTKTPDYPWQRIGMDLFQLNGQQYLLMGGLLFQMEWNSPSPPNNSSCGDWTYQIHLRKTWHSWDCSLWRWPSV